MEKTYQTSKLERLSYGGYFFGQNVIYAIQYQFLVYYYTESVGLTIASTTMLLLIARLWDAFNDPIMGVIVDKTNFNGEKYLPWLKFCTYIIPLSLFFVFININASYSIKLVYAYITYIFWGMMYTISDAPLFSLSTVMTNNMFERDKLISYGRLAAALAAISTAVFILLKTSIGWSMAVGVYCILAFISMFPLQFYAKERIRYKRSENVTFAKSFKYLFKNKYLLIYYLGFLAIHSTNTLQTMVAYFANSNLGNEGLVTIIMGATILPVVVIAPFLPVLIRKIGKKKLTIYSCIIAIILCVVQYFAGYENFILFLMLSVVRVLFMQIPLLIYGMFTADCIEYGAYINGERSEGMAFSIQTFITKLSGAIGGTICLMILSYSGYVEQASQQSESSLKGIWIALTLVPAIGYSLMLIVMIFYRLDEADVAKFMELNQKKQWREEDEGQIVK